MKTNLILKFLVVTISLVFFKASLAVPEGEPVPPLFVAIGNADIEPYKKEMKKLLEGSMKDFIKVIEFETKEGNTIFHLMAGVRVGNPNSTHQSFFAKEMIKLSNIFHPGKIMGHTSLGDVEISIPFISNTKLIDSIEKLDISALLLTLDQLEKGSTIEWIQNMHARWKVGKEDRGKSLKALVANFKEEREGFIGKYTDKSLHNMKVNRAIEKIKKYKYISKVLFEHKNKEGLLAIQVAYNSKNLPAYTVIEEQRKKDYENDLLFGGMLGGFVLLTGLSFYSMLFMDYHHSWGLLPSIGIHVSLPVGGALAGSFVSSKCYDIFQKRKKKQIQK